jgi:hypothetical protein
MEERIQERVQNFMIEETERIVRERDAVWTKELAKLKAVFLGKTIQSDGSPNLDSQQGSCSRDAHAMMKELELHGVRKKLDLIQDDFVVGEEKQIQEKTEVVKMNEEKTEVEKNEEANIDLETINEGEFEVEQVEVEEMNEEKIEVEKKTEENIELEKINEEELEVVEVEDDQVAGMKVGVVPELADMEYELAIDSPTNIVAYATVDTEAVVVHGKPIGEGNAKVSITRAIQGSAKIPFPISDEIVTVKDAVATYISWPKNLIIEGTSTAVKGSPKVKLIFMLCESCLSK